MAREGKEAGAARKKSWQANRPAVRQPLPSMRQPDNNPLVAVSCSDLHFWHIPPIARSVEPNWLGVLEGYMGQLCQAATFTHTRSDGSLTKHQVPVVLAGDLFDRWDARPELLHLLFKHLPEKVYAVCGQHDLPEHRYDAMHKSGYGVLVQAGRITNLPPGEPVEVPGYVPVRLHGFPWGFDPKPCQYPSDLCLEIAVIHRYIYTSKTGYPGAPHEKRLGCYYPDLKGYDIALFGDNHQGFYSSKERPTILNHGAFVLRKQDERAYKPCVGLIYADGTVKRQYLDTSKDKWLEPEQIAEAIQGIGAETFVEALRDLGDQALDFAAAVHAIMERQKVPQAVKDMIVRALGAAKGEKQ